MSWVIPWLSFGWAVFGDLKFCGMKQAFCVEGGGKTARQAEPWGLLGVLLPVDFLG
jgi:hypothetical protein